MAIHDVRIVTDSSSDLLELAQADLAVAPLKIITDRREFTDDNRL